MRCGAVVLCGGLSSRMGRPKALLPWRGRTMIEHAVGVLREATDAVVVVTSAELDLPPLPAKVVRDLAPRLGPLGGLRDGLEQLDAELAYATSTDAPFLTPEFVRAMLAFGQAAAPEIGGFIQPLCAAYPVALAATAGELLSSGRTGLLHLLEAANFRKVLPAELPDLRAARGCNTPQEYFAALQEDGAPLASECPPGRAKGSP